MKRQSRVSRWPLRRGALRPYYAGRALNRQILGERRTLFMRFYLMSNFDRYASPRPGAGYARSGVAVDQGLRAYMIGVYNYMTLGLGVTGLVAYAAFALGTVDTGNGRLALTDFGHAIYASPLRWLIVLSPLALVFWLSARINSMSVATARNAFLAFAALIGLSMSALMMGVIGLIVASLLNLFLHSTGLQFGISLLAVVIFAGLTAWDTQSIKQMYAGGDSYEMVHKKSIHGALRLYLDFINMFQAILMLTGSQRNS